MAATALFAAAMKKGGGGSGTSDEEKGLRDINSHYNYSFTL